MVRTAISCDPGRDSPLVTCCVRFFKYLMPEYGLEFSANMCQYVAETLKIRSDPPAGIGTWPKLQQLYGTTVIPDRLCDLLHGSPGTLEHHGRSSGSDGHSSGLQLDVEQQVGVMLQQLCLRCEERPVTTRFWLFAPCVNILFRWVLLGLPPQAILKTGGVKLFDVNSKRILKVQEYLNRPNTLIELATSVLCLRLTAIATSMTGRKFPNGRSSGSAPLLVQLARGDILQRTGRELASILAHLDRDESLKPHLGGVVERLLITQGQLVVRFRRYKTYPSRLALLCVKFNPTTHTNEAVSFLHSSASERDAGYSSLLFEEAWSAGGDLGGAVQHLLSAGVQEELCTMITAIEGTTLEVERKHCLDRRGERRRVDTVGKASRDGFIRVWRAEASRERRLREEQKRQCDNNKVKHLNVVALACQMHPALFPQAAGHLRWQGDAGSLANSSKLRHGRSSGPLHQFVADHRAELCSEVKRLKAAAARAATDGRSSGSVSSKRAWPLSKAEWVSWCQANTELFKETLREVKSGCRNIVNARLTPHKDFLAAEAPPPKETAATRAKKLIPWAALLQNGWYALRLHGDDTRIVIFVVSVWCGVSERGCPQVPGCKLDHSGNKNRMQGCQLRSRDGCLCCKRAATIWLCGAAHHRPRWLLASVVGSSAGHFCDSRCASIQIVDSSEIWSRVALDNSLPGGADRGIEGPPQQKGLHWFR